MQIFHYLRCKKGLSLLVQSKIYFVLGNSGHFSGHIYTLINSACLHIKKHKLVHVHDYSLILIDYFLSIFLIEVILPS